MESRGAKGAAAPPLGCMEDMHIKMYPVPKVPLTNINAFLFFNYCTVKTQIKICHHAELNSC